MELFLYAMLISSQPATTVSLCYPSLAHYTHHWFWVTVILLEVRDDPDVNRPPTRRATRFRQPKMPSEPIYNPEEIFFFFGTFFMHKSLTDRLRLS